MTDTMAARVRLALTIARPDIIPARFRDAYQRGGTPTSTHLVAIASAAGTTPIWLMTGWPASHAIRTAEEPSPCEP
ncbi:hypothetical protein [Streptomyces mexicanus]|uniref:hypothetical protein n=1 Tax=Streptomyces mexicanus TaxID=178566 RepID=UPI00365AE2AB